MRSAMLAALFLCGCLCGCASQPSRAPAAPPEPEREPHPTIEPDRTPAASPTPNAAACLVVQADSAPAPASVEGTLSLAASIDGKPAPGLLVLRLVRPRCIVGLAHASYVTEVYVASTGTDLRPFLDQHIQITGDLLAGNNDLGGPAVVLLAKDFAR
jgi:hypothetical protein